MGNKSLDHTLGAYHRNPDFSMSEIDQKTRSQGKDRMSAEDLIFQQQQFDRHGGPLSGDIWATKKIWDLLVVGPCPEDIVHMESIHTALEPYAGLPWGVDQVVGEPAVHSQELGFEHSDEESSDTARGFDFVLDMGAWLDSLAAGLEEA